jgi:hypothetical protein
MLQQLVMMSCRSTSDKFTLLDKSDTELNAKLEEVLLTMLQPTQT